MATGRIREWLPPSDGEDDPVEPYVVKRAARIAWSAVALVFLIAVLLTGIFQFWTLDW